MGYQKTPLSRFLNDTTMQGAALYYLVKSIEIILNIGNHILAEEFKINPDSYANIIGELGKQKVIPASFARTHMDMAKFRNRIIHIYEDVNLREIYRHLQTATSACRKFSRYFLNSIQ